MQAILDFFQKFIDAISSNLQFVIDDISTEDSSAVGVTWHLGKHCTPVISVFVFDAKFHVVQ